MSKTGMVFDRHHQICVLFPSPSRECGGRFVGNQSKGAFCDSWRNVTIYFWAKNGTSGFLSIKASNIF